MPSSSDTGGDKRVLKLYRLSSPSPAVLQFLAEGEIPLLPLPEHPSDYELAVTEHYAAQLSAAGARLALNSQPKFKVGQTRIPGSECPAVPIPSRSTSRHLWSAGEIDDYLTNFTEPGTEVAVLGTSVEGRPLRAVKFGPLNPVSYGPSVHVVAGQHAREWGAVGAGMELIFALSKILGAGGTERPDLYQALYTGSIVVMPLANPDGYEHSRIDDRMWRGNKSPSCPNGGVNLNRNHEATWSVPASATGLDCYPGPGRDDAYRGPGAGSEPETQAIGRLLMGTAFELPESPVAVLDIHTYADFLVYPSGVKQNADADGPACDMDRSNCTSADHGALRELLGNTYSHRANPPLFLDPTYSPGMFRRDQGPNIIYRASGTLLDQAAYGTRNPRSLSATVELFSREIAFSIECMANHDDLIETMTATVTDGIERVLSHGAALLDANASTSFFPTRRGVWASGFYARDYPLGTSSDEVRATFLKPVWKELDVANISATFSGGGGTHNLRRWRPGTAYNLHALPLNATRNELCLPCSVYTFAPGTDYASQDLIPECTDCVDMCDPARPDVSTSGWQLTAGTRGSARDCWWEPASPGELLLSGQFSPLFSSHCTFTVSLEISEPTRLRPGSLQILRATPSGAQEVVWDTMPSLPYAQVPPMNGVFTLILEADELLPVNGRTPTFRFVADQRAVEAGVKLFDPVTTCRNGLWP